MTRDRRKVKPSGGKSGLTRVTGRLVLCACLLSSPITRAEIKEVEVEGIAHFSRWTGAETFAGELAGFGGQPQTSAMPWLAQQGFKTVIALRLAEEDGVDLTADRAAAESAGLSYVHLPFDYESASPDQIERVLAAMGDQNNQPVFIHCKSGTRVASLWMLGRIGRDGLQPAAAAREGSVIAAKPEEAVRFVKDYLSAAGQ